MPKVRGSDRECQAATAQEWPRGATPRPRSGATAEKSYHTPEVRGGGERSNPTSNEWRLARRRRAKSCYSTFKVRRDDLLQGKKQWLCFAGAAMKRYPMSKVRETQVRR